MNNNNINYNYKTKKNESTIDLNQDELNPFDYDFAQTEQEDENEKKSLRSTKKNFNNNFAAQGKELLKNDKNLRVSATHEKVNLMHK